LAQVVGKDPEVTTYSEILLEAIGQTPLVVGVTFYFQSSTSTCCWRRFVLLIDRLRHFYFSHLLGVSVTRLAWQFHTPAPIVQSLTKVFFYVKSPKGGMQRNDGGYDASCEANDATDDPLPDAARPGGEGNVLRSIVLRQPAEAMHHLSRVRACLISDEAGRGRPGGPCNCKAARLMMARRSCRWEET